MPLYVFKVLNSISLFPCVNKSVDNSIELGQISSRFSWTKSCYNRKAAICTSFNNDVTMWLIIYSERIYTRCVSSTFRVDIFAYFKLSRTNACGSKLASWFTNNEEWFFKLHKKNTEISRKRTECCGHPKFNWKYQIRHITPYIIHI